MDSEKKNIPAENIIRLAVAGEWVTRKENPAENIIRLAGAGQWTARKKKIPPKM